MRITVIYLVLFNIGVFSEWSQIITTGSVPQLKNASAIYVSSSNKMYVFGGRTPTGLSNELWSLDLSSNNWIQVNANNSPPAPRYTQNAYYDSAANRMIIWSGQGTVLYNDVWAYNLGTNLWQQLWPDGNTSGVPLKRYGTGSVFDPVTRNIFTFAGFTTSGRFEDTWAFHTDNMAWIDRTNNPHPPKRCLHSACFANDMRKMIIYAGQDTGPLDDIWSLDINSFVWQNLTPAIKPPGRFFYSMIYTGNGNIAVFGGLSTAALGDMWKFSLANNLWEQVSQGSPAPEARWGHTAVYIPSDDRMIIFGGEGAVNYNDTWQFNNVSVIGIKQTGTEIPLNFSLEQNYPNPFNPSTTIRFSIPREAGNMFTKLSIYDMLGRESAVLVNDELEPGNYKIEWDGSNFTSGVYFYRLTSGDITITKKMTLVK